MLTTKQAICLLKKANFLIVTGIMACLLLPSVSQAEPYLAVRTGLKCMSCHVNPTGGGKRTQFGNVYGQTSLAEEQILKDGGWDGRLNKYIAFGGNLRANFNYEDVPNSSSTNEFETERANIYMEFNLIPDRLTFYLDEKVAPGGALNREAFALLWSKDKNYYLKAGQFFLPHGIRLEDDTAFIREITGINFNSYDNGVEAGLETSSWSTQLAITNGTSGGSETNDKKQFSLRAEYIQPGWRLGGSHNHNYGDDGADREISSLFVGARFLGIDWLAEVDTIKDETTATTLEQMIYFFEGNLEVTKGHNLKLSFDQYDPDESVEEDDQARASLVWEYSPFEHLQIRTGYRKYDGIPQDDEQNKEKFFLQMHTYF